MKLLFGAVVLGDSESDPRVMFTIDTWGGQSVTQKEELALSDYQFRAARGNVIGQIIVTSKCSHATEDDAIVAVANAYALLDTTADLKYYNRSNALAITWQDAVLEQAQKVILDGVRAEIRFTFSVTTQTIHSAGELPETENPPS